MSPYVINQFINYPRRSHIVNIAFPFSSFFFQEKTVDILMLSLALFCPLVFLGGLLIYACRR